MCVWKRIRNLNTWKRFEIPWNSQWFTWQQFYGTATKVGGLQDSSTSGCFDPCGILKCLSFIRVIFSAQNPVNSLWFWGICSSHKYNHIIHTSYSWVLSVRCFVPAVDMALLSHNLSVSPCSMAVHCHHAIIYLWVTLPMAVGRFPYEQGCNELTLSL